MRMNICASANSKYVRYLYVMLTSLFYSNPIHDIYVYIFEWDFTESDKNVILHLGEKHQNQINFIEVDQKRFESFPLSSHFTVETYFRFLIPSMIPDEVHKILYLDVDIIVRGDLEELFEIDMEEYLFAACPDLIQPELIPMKRNLFHRYDDLRYFNAGVMLWNMDRVRKNVTFEDFMKGGAALGFNLPSVDQDILNYLYYDKTMYIDAFIYNYLVIYDLENGISSQKAKILHFCKYNPWQIGPKSETYREWWRYAAKTPYYEGFLEEQLERVEKDIFDQFTGEEQLKKEKKFENFYECLELLYELKGMGKCNQIFAGKKIVIYGAGNLGNKLYKLFLADNAIKRVAMVFDEKKPGKLFGQVIENDIERLYENYNMVVIVTPSDDTELIIADIRMRAERDVEVISLKDFLVKLSGEIN